jgi:hypothetical protein
MPLVFGKSSPHETQCKEEKHTYSFKKWGIGSEELGQRHKECNVTGEPMMEH